MLLTWLFTTSASLLAVVSALPTTADGTSTSVDSKQTCITKLNDVSSVPPSLPTRTQTSVRTIRSTITTCGTLSTTTITITPAAVTSTILVNGTSASLPHIVTMTAPADNAQTCPGVSKGSAKTVTVYTGSYNGTVAKRTASPSDAAPRHHVNVFHQFGQRVMGHDGQKAFAVDCLKQVTSHIFGTFTNTEEPAIETVTAEVPTVYVTQQNQAVSAIALVSITSTITAPSAVNTSAAGDCTVSGAASTTTQHIKCAPSNLIGNVDGHGIAQTGGPSNTTRGLAPGGDPSACCQLCVDTEGCAASEDDKKAKNCFLWYTTPSCGLGFQFSDGGQDLQPGTGFLVQAGCGEIEGVSSFD